MNLEHIAAMKLEPTWGQFIVEVVSKHDVMFSPNGILALSEEEIQDNIEKQIWGKKSDS